MGEEKELFDVVRNTRGLTEVASRRVLSEVKSVSRKIDLRKLEIKKSNLIKEVNYGFGDLFYDSRVPDYRLLATIQTFLDTDRTPSRLTESVQLIRMEEVLVHHMMTRAEALPAIENKGEIDRLVMSMVAKRFGEKYNSSLIPAQKNLLEKFIRYQVANDEVPLRLFIEQETKRVREALDAARLMKEITEDPEMVKKLEEARANLNSHRDITLAVEDLMLYQKLVEEIQSDE